MTLRVNLSDQDVRELHNYLADSAADSLRSFVYVPDALFLIIGELSVGVRSHIMDLTAKANEDCKESVQE